jgi:hypothetical protein
MNANESDTSKRLSSFRSCNHVGFVDLHWGFRLIAMIGWNDADFHDDVEARLVGRFAKSGVLTIEVSVLSSADEELRTAGVRVAGASHRKNASFVRCLVEFGFDVVAGATHSGTFGATALDHETVDDAMKNKAVVIADFRKAEHVFHVTRCNIGKHIEFDLAHRCVELELIIIFAEVDVCLCCGYFRLTIFSHDRVR